MTNSRVLMTTSVFSMNHVARRAAVILQLALSMIAAGQGAGDEPKTQPNFIVIFCDDMVHRENTGGHQDTTVGHEIVSAIDSLMPDSGGWMQRRNRAVTECKLAQSEFG